MSGSFNFPPRQRDALRIASVTEKGLRTPNETKLMRFSLALVFSLTPLFVWVTPVAAATGSGSYNYYEKRGNVEAMNADFDAAIKDWQRAEQLAPQDPRKGCRGEFQRVQIRAASDAKAQMASHHLTRTQGAAWYERHHSELWIPNKCNGP